jgi:hypothetical protein
MNLPGHLRSLIAWFAQRLRARWLDVALGGLCLFGPGLAVAQEAIRLPPPGLSGTELPLQMQARPFEQSGQLREPSFGPNGLDFEQPQRLPLPSPEMIQAPQPGDGLVVPEGLNHGAMRLNALDQPNPFPAPARELNCDGTVKLSPYKDGFFQKLSLSAAWLGDGNSMDDLGITEIETSLTVALPAPIREWPLFIMPGYNLYLISDPGGGRDMPPQLHTVYVDFTWAPLFFENHRLLLTVAPSLYSDFQGNSSDGFRLTGKAIYVWDYVPDKVQVAFGVLYLNRDDIRLLPAGGVIWKPTPDYNFELIFPKPKLGMRVNVGNGYEDWIFLTAEFGGNTWAITRESGDPDKLTWADYRLMFGYERKLDGGAGYRLEGGYVFGRSVEYASGIGDFDPRDTFIIRGGITF